MPNGKKDHSAFEFQKYKANWMALSVHRPAVANPDDTSGLSVVEFFTEKLNTTNVVLVPPSFEMSGD